MKSFNALSISKGRPSYSFATKLLQELQTMPTLLTHEYPCLAAYFADRGRNVRFDGCKFKLSPIVLFYKNTAFRKANVSSMERKATHFIYPMR